MQLAGCGISTAALAFGGDASPQAVTELWNGSSWSEVNDLNLGRQRLAGAGITTSALAFGGQNPIKAETESWNGTNWTEVADLAVARRFLGGAGINNTSALAFGGATPDVTQATEEWNAGPTLATIGTS